MLRKLYVRNYALIDELEIQFSDSMNIITGETGAGKSILLGALSLILGQRANNVALPSDNQKCIVEGTFYIKPYYLQSFFEENGLDYDDETVLRREVTVSGKSRAFINDTPVHLPLLKQLSEQLVSLHAQHQTLHLYDANYHLFIIDALAKHSDLLDQYRQNHTQYRQNQQGLKAMEEKLWHLQKDHDYVVFQLNELAEARLENADEQEALEQELDKLNNAEAIKKNLSESVFCIEDDESSVLRQLNRIKSLLNGIVRYGAAYEEIKQRIDSVCIELRDVANELSGQESDILIDPERASDISERLNLLFRLQKKHGVRTVQELMDLEADLAGRNLSADQLKDDIAQQRKQIEIQRKKLLEQARQISANRVAQFPTIEKRINDLLADVGMPKASIQMAHQTLVGDAFSTTGIDEIELLFAANKGSQPSELRKVASGGELSRLMLCIQSLLADNTALPTLIFDEIDTGISGEVALKVGVQMQKLAAKHQVVCITHLPQIASRGNRHIFVYKDEHSDKTISRIKTLNDQERVTEIAKMLSGDQPTSAAIANAKALLRQKEENTKATLI